ncbi:MAG: leucine--tRNA ligase [Bacteroidales bacterium]|nr:leucine--tRNA ligase [Bacteroidales bacterium]MCF8334012.1 leucine--tRNA ligase [Bacteroidales bacterium]
MEYNFREIEKKWQKYWEENKTFKTHIDHNKPKYYVLDMFPYPSGSGLHVGHPLGYIASDIFARFKRHQGYNVLHPMGYDAYGLPAEQYAIQTGTHPKVTTEKNIKRYREQLDQIGFSFDWDREVRTCDPEYYKWTQWTFIKLFKHWFNNKTNQAEPIDELIKEFENNGSQNIDASCDPHESFTAAEWNQMSEKEQQQILMNYRLAYLSETMVNWCPALGTVLANDEVKDGYSERGGHPVERKKMKQWSLRISAYAQRLLEGLEKINWSESIKEVQRNWIGRSEGATVYFKIKEHDKRIDVFTTRPDTLFGSTFMVLAPEHDLVEEITTDEHKKEVEEYVNWAKNRSERDRISDVKKITGVFTGAYGVNPVNGKEVPIWVADYVLSGYGSGAIMAVPGHDSRDFAFAKHFNLPIIQVVVKKDEEPTDPADWSDSYDSKEGVMINSGFLNGMDVNDAITETIKFVENKGIGYGTVNYRLRDAIFSRQRYWGEPFPIYYKDGVPYPLNESELPLELPEVDKYQPTEEGDPPLARAKNWKTKEGYPLEVNTMPGFAGSSGYYYRYMDPRNNQEYFSKEAVKYWRDVDLYMGGEEHATGHLMYARFWSHFLYDLGLTVKTEPFKRLINQGKIQGRSNFVYRVVGTKKFVSYYKRKEYDTQRIHVDVNIVHNDELDIQAFREWMPEYQDAEFILEDNGTYVCGAEVEKMSKSKHNVVNPDDLIEQYGADTFRLYEMFLGPIYDDKPWDTQGIEGVFRFVKKFWRLFHDENNNFNVSEAEPDKKELKILHQTIKKVTDDMERFSFNTTISQFMICTNQLNELKCNKRAILEPLTVLLSPFAPHLAEELWRLLGHEETIAHARDPEFNEEYIKESTHEYPVSFNGKMRFKMELPLDMPKEEIEKKVLEEERAQKYLQGKTPKKVIVVPKKIINVVV